MPEIPQHVLDAVTGTYEAWTRMAAAAQAADAASPGSAVTDAAAAIVALQTEIQISTCISCHGRRTQAMVLEPYNTMPCLRCRGEGVTHDVPPGRYKAVLTALLDALGGAPVEQVVARLALLAEPFNPQERL